MGFLPNERNAIETMPPNRARDRALTEPGKVLYLTTPTTSRLPNHERNPACLQPARVLCLTAPMILTSTTPPDSKSSIDSAPCPDPPTCPSPARSPNPASIETTTMSLSPTIHPTNKTGPNTNRKIVGASSRMRTLGGSKPTMHTRSSPITMRVLVLGALTISPKFLLLLLLLFSSTKVSTRAVSEVHDTSMINDYDYMIQTHQLCPINVLSVELTLSHRSSKRTSRDEANAVLSDRWNNSCPSVLITSHHSMLSIDAAFRSKQ